MTGTLPTLRHARLALAACALLPLAAPADSPTPAHTGVETSVDAGTLATTPASVETTADTTVDAKVDALGTWTAEYRVLHGRSTIGEAHFRLENGEQAGTKLLESRTEARGLARMLRSRPVIESTTFLSDGALSPLAYRFQDGSRKGKKNMHIDFDHSQGQATSLYQGDTYELPLDDSTLDRLLVMLAMMRDAAEGTIAEGYQVADKREVKTYYLEGPESEMVETPAGTFDTLHFTRLREGSSRVMEMWLAPELGYLPVRMRHTKEGDETARLELTATSKLQ